MSDKVQLIIAKYLSGECTNEEYALLQDWLKEAEHKQEFEQIKSGWRQAEALLNTPRFNTASAWQKVAAQTTDVPNKFAKKVYLPNWLKFTAAAAVLALGFFIWPRLSKDDATLQIAAGNTNKELTLPDNSKVTLRAGSSIAFAKQFNGPIRSLDLKGDARFTVQRNEQKPFVVHTHNATIQVLGTAFDIHTDNNATSVVVNSGMVSVKDGEQNEAFLIAHQQAIINANGISKDTLLFNNSVFWQTNELRFTAQPLHLVLADIAKATQSQIELDKDFSDTFKNQKVTISFKAMKLEEMLTELCLISKCNWQKQGSKYLVLTK